MSTPASKEPLVVLEALRVGYDAPLLPPIDLTLSRGDFLGVVGPNGSGKTTLLRTISGVLRPLGGNLRMPGGRPRIGYVPQGGSLDEIFPFSAREVVALNLVPTLGPFSPLGRRHIQRADAALARVGLGDRRQTPFRHLSGGQKQRVLLARALVIEPDLLILDEPTSALDPTAAHMIIDALRTLHGEGRMGIVLVSHQLALAANVCDQLAIVDKQRSVFRVGPCREIATADGLRQIYGEEGARHVLELAVLRTDG